MGTSLDYSRNGKKASVTEAQCAKGKWWGMRSKMKTWPRLCRALLIKVRNVGINRVTGSTEEFQAEAIRSDSNFLFEGLFYPLCENAVQYGKTEKSL